MMQAASACACACALFQEIPLVSQASRLLPFDLCHTYGSWCWSGVSAFGTRMAVPDVKATLAELAQASRLWPQTVSQSAIVCSRPFGKYPFHPCTSIDGIDRSFLHALEKIAV